VFLHDLILPPNQPYDGKVENGKENQRYRMGKGKPIHLIENEQTENNQRPGVCPQLILEERNHQHNLDKPMAQKIRTTEGGAAE